MSEPLSKIEKHVFVEEDNSLVIDILEKACEEFSKQKLKAILNAGSVWLTRNGSTQRVRRSKRELKIGDQLHLYYDEKIFNQDIKDARLIADEKDYSVWFKPKGMLSQGTKWGDANAICRWVEVNGFSDRPSYQIHRLDRATSGLILVGHNKKIASELIKLFEQRQIEKHYRAMVKGQFPDLDQLSEIATDIDGRKAHTQILETVYNSNQDVSYLKVKITTGRKHQIRKHLAMQDFPILGDRMYGKALEDGSELKIDLQLESCYLGFNCPVDFVWKSFSC